MPLLFWTRLTEGYSEVTASSHTISHNG